MMGMVSQQDFALLVARVEALEKAIKAKDDEIAAIRSIRPLMVYGRGHPALPVSDDPLVWCVSHDPTIMDQQ